VSATEPAPSVPLPRREVPLDPALAAAAPGGVLVVDYGAQYSQLIARRIRECRVFSALVPHDTTPEAIAALKPAGLVLSGGPASVYAPGAPALDPALLDLGIPVLGICYGMQAMALGLGGEVARTGAGEYGGTPLRVRDRSGMFGDLPAESCWMSHRDAVVRAPEGFLVSAETDSSPVAAMENAARRMYGVQFHPEVVHTQFGTDLLKGFLFDVCDCAPTWTATAVIEDQVERIRAQVGEEHAICALSGGVDSAVAALLVHRAIGDRLTCVFVDHGLMRQNEGEQVADAFGRHFHVPLIHVRAEERFLSALAGVTDPEQKRKIIGREFIRIFEAEAAKLGDVRVLVQGTLYSDVIESGSRDAATIKSHHNVGGLPEDMAVRLVEPLRQLFKDEVRMVGEELGLPERMVWRQPFPGPGLAIRIIGEVTAERLEILRRSDHVLQEEIRRAGLYRQLWQSFAVLPAVRSVGVQGDERTYAYPIVIRAVTSDDAMTADWARLPPDLLERIAARIINEVPGVNRVALDITSKPPGTIEWE
jgi:GMP synthase (glutamine-hydrolysing)